MEGLRLYKSDIFLILSPQAKLLISLLGGSCALGEVTVRNLYTFEDENQIFLQAINMTNFWINLMTVEQGRAANLNIMSISISGDILLMFFYLIIG